MEGLKEFAGVYAFRKQRNDQLSKEQKEKMAQDAEKIKDYESDNRLPEAADGEELCAKDFLTSNQNTFESIAANINHATRLWLNGMINTKDMMVALDKVTADAKFGVECSKKAISLFTNSGRQRNVEERIKNWRKENPDGDQQACVLDTGISKSSVYKYWGEDNRIHRRKRKKQEAVPNDQPVEKAYFEDGELIKD